MSDFPPLFQNSKIINTCTKNNLSLTAQTIWQTNCVSIVDVSKCQKNLLKITIILKYFSPNILLPERLQVHEYLVQ